MKKNVWLMVMMAVICACSGKNGKSQTGDDGAKAADSVQTISVKYATGFSVRDTAGIRLVDVDGKYHFA